MQAIDTSMNIVRDQLRQTIKDQLCRNNGKSNKASISRTNQRIQDRRLFDVNNDNFKNFQEVICTVIDFYNLFKKSTASIIKVWESKLTHIDNLYYTLEMQH